MKLTCLRCNANWQPRKEGDQPLRCPRCGSANWNKDKQTDITALLERREKIDQDLKALGHDSDGSKRRTPKKEKAS